MDDLNGWTQPGLEQTWLGLHRVYTYKQFIYASGFKCWISRQQPWVLIMHNYFNIDICIIYSQLQSVWIVSRSRRVSPSSPPRCVALHTSRRPSAKYYLLNLPNALATPTNLITTNSMGGIVAGSVLHQGFQIRGPITPGNFWNFTCA